MSAIKKCSAERLDWRRSQVFREDVTAIRQLEKVTSEGTMRTSGGTASQAVGTASAKS